MPSSSPQVPPVGPAALRGGRRALRGLVLAVCLAGALAGCSGVSASGRAQEQIDFGVAMAKQGLWSEALFRFERASRLDPNDYRVLNNLAVAYEATGEFDRALDVYKQALRVQPDNRDLRRNYARFVEFYQSFHPSGEKAAEGAAGTAPDSTATPPPAPPAPSGGG